MIAVVKLLQLLASRYFIQVIHGAQGADVFGKERIEFLLRNTADCGIAIIHRDVVEIIQIAKDAYLAEFCYSGEKGELDVFVATLQDAVESFQGVAIIRLQRFVSDGLEERLVVFVDEDDHVAGGCPIYLFDQIGETFLWGSVALFLTIDSFPTLQMLIQYGRERRQILIPASV